MIPRFPVVSERLAPMQLSRFKPVLLSLALAGCGPAVATGVPGLAQVDILTVMGTEKSLVDHAVSYSSGKDCSYVYVEKGNRYCKEDEPVIKPMVHCYRTLASATCYSAPDPYGNGEKELGNNDHNMATAKKPR